MRSYRLLYSMLLVSCLATAACSQSQNTASTEKYTGTTPGGALIRSMIKIPPGDSVEFIKWNMQLDRTNAGFSLTALYGISQPNTNGFKNGGTQLSASGKFSIEQGADNNPGLKVYKLLSDQFSAAIFLVAMDENIFHFADSGKKMILGNAGFGYVLNKVK